MTSYQARGRIPAAVEHGATCDRQGSAAQGALCGRRHARIVVCLRKGADDGGESSRECLEEARQLLVARRVHRPLPLAGALQLGTASDLPHLCADRAQLFGENRAVTRVIGQDEPRSHRGGGARGLDGVRLPGQVIAGSFNLAIGLGAQHLATGAPERHASYLANQRTLVVEEAELARRGVCTSLRHLERGMAPCPLQPWPEQAHPLRTDRHEHPIVGLGRRRGAEHMQARVEERGMNPVLGRITRRQLDASHCLAVAAPQGRDTAKRRTVAHANRREALVVLPDVHELEATPARLLHRRRLPIRARGARGSHLAGGVPRPDVVDVVQAVDAERRLLTASLQLHLQQSLAVGGQRERRLDRDAGQLWPLKTEHVGRFERDLDVSGRRQQGVAVDAVIAEISGLLRAQPALEQRLRAANHADLPLQERPQPWLGAAARLLGGALRHPVARSLERIRRQELVVRCAPMDGVPVHRRPFDVEAAKSALDRRAARLAAAQGRHPRQLVSRQTPATEPEQRRRGPNLEKRACAELVQRAHPVREANGLPDMPRPVRRNPTAPRTSQLRP